MEKNASIKYKERHLNELETWLNEMGMHPVISKQVGFNQCKSNVNYLKGRNYVAKNQINDAIRIFWELQFCKEKIKLLMAIILPKPVVEYFSYMKT